MARNAMLDTGPLSCLRRFQSGRRTKALDVSPREGHQMGHGEKRAFLHADSQGSWQDIAQMYSQRRLGRQKGLFRARYSRNVFPNTVFHCFSPLKTYIRSLCCQQHAVRACISATYCHEEALLPSEPPLGIHDNRFLPLFNAQPFHAGHSGGRPASGQRRMRESACKRLAPDKGGCLARSPR